MPRVMILEGHKVFINGSLHRAGGVAQIRGKRDKSNRNFSEKSMRFVDDDTPLCVEGPRHVVGPQVLSAADIEARAEAEAAALGEVEREELAAAFGRLEQDDDSHWTEKGLPNLRVVSEFAGRQVTHQMREAVAPDLKRQE